MRSIDSEPVVIPMPLLDPEDRVVLDYGVSLHARWASSTGFRSCGGDRAPEITGYDYDGVLALAQFYFDRSAAKPYLVGGWDCEGWPVLRECYMTGGVMFRMPGWVAPEIEGALSEAFGVKQICRTNNFYSFPTNVDRASATEALRPLMEKGTRLADQSMLAARLLASTSRHQHSQLSMF